MTGGRGGGREREPGCPLATEGEGCELLSAGVTGRARCPTMMATGLQLVFTKLKSCLTKVYLCLIEVLNCLTFCLVFAVYLCFVKNSLFRWTGPCLMTYVS